MVEIKDMQFKYHVEITYEFIGVPAPTLDRSQQPYLLPWAQTWLKENNIEYNLSNLNNYISFKNETDAMAFKLRWL